jgi:pentatricopeptide repeat protein
LFIFRERNSLTQLLRSKIKADMNVRYPDFTHKQTRLGLWLNDCCKPAWVDAEIAAMVPGTVQLNMFTWNKRLAEYVKTRQAKKAMQLFQHLQQDGMKPDKFTFVQVLNACASV